VIAAAKAAVLFTFAKVLIEYLTAQFPEQRVLVEKGVLIALTVPLVYFILLPLARAFGLARGRHHGQQNRERSDC
jgi:hypothetical protein